MTGAVHLAATASDVVTWGQGAFSFELRSPDPRVRARATDVFRPWRAVATSPSRRWTVSPASGGSRLSITDESTGSVLVRADFRQAVTAVEYGAVAAIIDGPPDALTFHAALVARGRHGVLILGPSEAGKSTLASALWRHGWIFLGDDVAIVDAGTAEARSAPRRVALRGPSRALLGDALWSRIAACPSADATGRGLVFHPRDIDGLESPPSVRLAACLFLARRGVDHTGARIRRIAPAQAALALLPYSNLVRRQDPGAVIAQISPLAARVPAFDCGRGPLPAMIAAVEGALDDGERV